MKYIKIFKNKNLQYFGKNNYSELVFVPDRY